MAGHITDMPSAAGDISRPDRNDVRYVDPDEDGVSSWPTVGLARVDAPPGGDDKTAELPRNVARGFIRCATVVPLPSTMRTSSLPISSDLRPLSGKSKKVNRGSRVNN